MWWWMWSGSEAAHCSPLPRVACRGTDYSVRGRGRGCISGSHVGGLGGHIDGILSSVDTLSRCSGFYSAMEREVGGYVTVIMKWT